MKKLKKQFNNTKASSISLLICCLQITSFAQNINFTEHIIDNQVNGIRGVYSCDIDNDNDNDIIVTSLYDHEVALWRNEGGTPVVFTKQIIDNELNTPVYIYAADVNNDGHIDVIASDYDAGEILWWQNDGNNPIIWTRHTVTDSFASAHGVFACDIDNDGNTDILGTSEGLDKILWWQNNGENPIVWYENIITENFDGTQSVFATDIDGDGDFDVMGTAGGDNEIALWYNEGGSPINWTKQTISNSFGFAHWVYATDVNGDNLPDILGAAFTGGDITCWYNEGGSPISWDKQVVDGNFYGALTVHGIDLDDDNDTDIIGTNWSSDDVVWWENDGNTPVSWTKHIIDGYFNGASPIFTADLDGDTDIDIVGGADVINGSGISAPLTWWENDLIITSDNSINPTNDNWNLKCFPVPFEEDVNLRYKIPSQLVVIIQIFDINGRLIIDILNAEQSPGEYSASWDGTDNTGSNVQAGIYFCKLQTKTNILISKIILTK